mgnify:CR=1|jgi:hypothetical protein
MALLHVQALEKHISLRTIWREILIIRCKFSQMVPHAYPGDESQDVISDGRMVV